MRHDEQVRVIKELCAHLDGDTNVDAAGTVVGGVVASGAGTTGAASTTSTTVTAGVVGVDEQAAASTSRTQVTAVGKVFMEVTVPYPQLRAWSFSCC